MHQRNAPNSLIIPIISSHNKELFCTEENGHEPIGFMAFLIKPQLHVFF